jgi:hypothetical protein
MKNPIFVLSFLFCLNAYAQNFTCDLEINGCSKGDRASIQCETEKTLFQNSLSVTCPTREDAEFHLQEFGFDKQIQMSVVCGMEKKIGLYILDKFNDSMGRTIGFTSTTADTPAVNLMATISQDLEGRENRVVFIMECYRQN